MQTTTTTAQTPREELSSLAHNIETYRADAGIPKTVFCRENDALDSVRTYDKILKGEDDLNEEKWLVKYRSLWSALCSTEVEIAANGSNILLKDLTAPARLCAAYVGCFRNKTPDRFILLTGPNGSGKTSALHVLDAQPYCNGNVRILEASAAWIGSNDHGTAVPLLQEIGITLGLWTPEKAPSRKTRLIHGVTAALRERRICLGIEETQHLCVHGLDTMKGLLNTTPTTIVATGQKDVYEKLKKTNSGRQLLGNRLAEFIPVGGGGGMSVEDVAVLADAFGVKGSNAEGWHYALTLSEREIEALRETDRLFADGVRRDREAINNLITEGKTRGCLKFAARVLAAYRSETDDTDGKPKMKPGADTLLALINREKRARDGAES